MPDPTIDDPEEDAGRVYGDLFAMVPEWVLLAEISDRAVRLFGVLHRHAGDKGRAHPGRQRLAKMIRCSVDSVDRATAELEAIGAVVRKARFSKVGDQTSNDYYLWPRLPGRRTAATRGRGAAAQMKASREREQENTPLVAVSDKPKPRRSQLPEQFFVTPEMRAWAEEKFPTVDLRLQTEQFCDYHRAKGSVMLDWTATWRTWIRNAGTRFAPRSSVAAPPRNVANITKDRTKQSGRF